MHLCDALHSAELACTGRGLQKCAKRWKQKFLHAAARGAVHEGVLAVIFGGEMAEAEAPVTRMAVQNAFFREYLENAVDRDKARRVMCPPRAVMDFQRRQGFFLQFHDLENTLSCIRRFQAVLSE